LAPEQCARWVRMIPQFGPPPGPAVPGARVAVALATLAGLLVLWLGWFLGSIPYAPWHPGAVLATLVVTAGAATGSLAPAVRWRLVVILLVLVVTGGVSLAVVAGTYPSAAVLAAELARTDVGSPHGAVVAHQGARVLRAVGEPTYAEAWLRPGADATVLARARAAFLAQGWTLTGLDTPTVVGGHEVIASRPGSWGSHFTVSVVLPDGFGLAAAPDGRPLAQLTGNRRGRL
jgi:hypothetical protein